MTDDLKDINPWADEPDEKEATTDEGGGKIDIVHFKPVEGDNTLRIVGKYKWFNEYWVNKVKRSVIAGPLKDCPINTHPDRQKNLDKAKALREAGKEEEAKALYRKTFQTFDPKVKYAVNVIDRADGQIKIWKFSRTLKEKIMTIASKYGDPTKYDLILTRKGKKLDTEYTIIPARENVDLTEEEKALKTFNLEKIFKPTSLDKVNAYLRGEIPEYKGSGESQEEGAEGESSEESSSGLSDDEIAELGSIGENL